MEGEYISRPSQIPSSLLQQRDHHGDRETTDCAANMVTQTGLPRLTGGVRDCTKNYEACNFKSSSPEDPEEEQRLERRTVQGREIVMESGTVARQFHHKDPVHMRRRCRSLSPIRHRDTVVSNKLCCITGAERRRSIDFDRLVRSTLDDFATIPVQSPLAVSESESSPFSGASPLSQFGSNVESTTVARSWHAIIAPILDDMIVNREDASALSRGLKSLGRFCGDSSSLVPLGSCGAIQIVVDTLGRFPTNEEIQALGMSFLRDASESCVPNKTQIGHSGGIKQILSTLGSSLPSSPEQVVACCATLSVCCDDCGLNQRQAGTSGGSEALLTAMRRWKTNVTVQEACLRALRAMATGSPENVRFIRESGGSSELLSALRQFSRHENVHQACIETAAELLEQSDEERTSMGASGFIDELAIGLAGYSRGERFILACSKCVRYLCFTRANRQRIAESEIVLLLIVGIEQWKARSAVVSGLLLALGNATFDDWRSKQVAGGSRAVESLVSLLDVHVGCATVIEQTCRVLRNISDGRQNIKRCLQKRGAISAVAHAIRQHACVAGVQEHGCAMLINLLSSHGAHVKKESLEGHLAQAARLHAGRSGAVQQIGFLQEELLRMSGRGVLLGSLFRRVGTLSVSNSSDKEGEKPGDFATSGWQESGKSRMGERARSALSRGSVQLRVGDTVIDAEDILRGDEIDAVVKSLSQCGDDVDY